MPDGGDSLESVVDQTLVAALPDRGAKGAAAASEGGAAATAAAGVPQIEAALASPAWRQKDAKLLSRAHGGGAAVISPERRALWRGVYLRREGGADAAAATAALYWETVKTCFGTSSDLPPDSPSSVPSCCDPDHAPSYCLKPAGRQSVFRLLACLAYNRPDVQRCPLLFPVAAALRHYLPEEDAYGLLCNMTESRDPRFFGEGQTKLEVEWRTAMQLNKKYNKKSLSQLSSLSKSAGEEELERLFRQWAWGIFDCLPFPHIVRIIDCYLIEGEKVLLRVCLALVRLFAKRGPTRASKKGGGLSDAYLSYCRDIDVSPNDLLRKAFAYRGFSRNEISSTALKAEVDLKAKGFSQAVVSRSRSSDNLPDGSAVDSIRAVSENLTYKQPRKRNAATYPVKKIQSAILKEQELIQIWHWLPERMTTVTPVLAYSSDEHGISLTTFYGNTENYEQTILVVKTTKGELFGAYCSAPWAERKYKDDRGNRQTYFGSGETFLFRLGEGEGDCKKYPWVGLKEGGSGDAGLSKAEQHARELFMSGQHDMVAIGGGEGNGIYLDASLTWGKTERCRTFDNPPLCSQEGGSGDFKVALIEVYGLNKLDL